MNPVVPEPKEKTPRESDRPPWWEPGFDDQADEPPPQQDDSP